MAILYCIGVYWVYLSGALYSSPPQAVDPSTQRLGSTADGTAMDSGVIRHFKMKLRTRLSKEDGGRWQVLSKHRMMQICEEVWDAIPIEDLRCYFDRLPKAWKEIKKRKGAWVGWSAKSNCRHRLVA